MGLLQLGSRPGGVQQVGDAGARHLHHQGQHPRQEVLHRQAHGQPQCGAARYHSNQTQKNIFGYYTLAQANRNEKILLSVKILAEKIKHFKVPP